MVTERNEFDVVIIGGGPAGMSAALWCDDLGLSSCLIERNEVLGGQLHWISHAINNYLGNRFDNGADCLKHFLESLQGRSFECLTGSEVATVDLSSMQIRLSSGRVIGGKTILVATGIRRRSHGVPGEGEFYNKGILDSGSKHRREVNGRRVAVIGGGDAAL